MRRRTFLAVTGTTASTIAVAGCSDGGGDGGGGGDGADGGGEDGGDGGGDGGDEDTPTPTGTPTASGGLTVAMITDGSDYYFDPIGLHVEAGDTVTWVNESGSHSSTAYHESIDAADATRIPDDAEPWNSEVLSEGGATFEHTFEAEGTYDYFCIPHKSLEMVGRIVVGEPGGPADGSMPPDGEVPESGTIVEQGTVSHEQFHG